jgi:hypothetical protein
MEQKDKEQKTNEEKDWQCGCCDFTSEKTQGMFRMMPFSFDRFGNSFSCRSMIKNMSCNSDKKNNS